MKFELLISACTVMAAVAADAVLGEPPRFHPLVGFGNIASKIDNWLFRTEFLNKSIYFQRAIGLLAVALVVIPPVMAVVWLAKLVPILPGVLVLYFAIGAKSLIQHAESVFRALRDGDIDESRNRVGLIVSRNTNQMRVEDIARATIESILENGSDAIFGALFWFVALGPAGAILFRLSNTLDAMWGYKTEKYIHFGWAAARLDDVLCFVPARLTAFSYALCGDFRLAITCWREQARSWYSPNAGPVMSSGAGALNVRLGGAAYYHGSLKERPHLGVGAAPTETDICRAIALIKHTLCLWLCVIFAAAFIVSAFSLNANKRASMDSATKTVSKLPLG